jgi:hypothetical protein
MRKTIVKVEFIQTQKKSLFLTNFKRTPKI